MRSSRALSRLVGPLLPLLVVGIGGCVSSPVTGASSPSPSPGFSPSALSGAPPTSDAVASSTTATLPAAAGLVVDPRLLDALPSSIDGVALEPDPTTAGRIAADPTLAGSASAIAVALAISPGTSASADNLAIVSVIRLRPGVFSEAWFRTWRDSYDAAACEVAGGIRGEPATTTVAGRTVYVGTCAGDARTFHLQLHDPTLIVSITSAGIRGFGRLVVAGIAE